MNNFFRRLTSVVSELAGTPAAFIAALLIVLIWAVCGPICNFSEIWQLAINTGTTVVTFLMTFLIQAGQNRDNKAIQLKLDELLASSKARNSMVNLEDAPEETINELKQEFKTLASGATATPSEPNPANETRPR